MLDMGSNLSLIDVELFEILSLPINPLHYVTSHCIDVDYACMINSLIANWVQVELGIPRLDYILTRLWVTEYLFDKGVPVVLGSHQIKKIFTQASLDRVDCWPRPWKELYEWCAVRNMFCKFI